MLSYFNIAPTSHTFDINVDQAHDENGHGRGQHDFLADYTNRPIQYVSTWVPCTNYCTLWRLGSQLKHPDIRVPQPGDQPGPHQEELLESNRFFYHISKAEAGLGLSYSGRTTSRPTSSRTFSCWTFLFLLFQVGATCLDDAVHPSWPTPSHRELASVVYSPHHGSSTDDAKGLHLVSCLVGSPTFYWLGGRGVIPLACRCRNRQWLCCRSHSRSGRLGPMAHIGPRLDKDFSFFSFSLFFILFPFSFKFSVMSFALMII